jgi:hypothetical protein
LLVLVVLIPLGATFGFASAASAHQSTSRDQAISARRTSLDLDTIMYARAAVTREYVLTAAIVYSSTRPAITFPWLSSTSSWGSTSRHSSP